MPCDARTVPGLERLNYRHIECIKRDVVIVHPRNQSTRDPQNLGNHHVRIPLDRQPRREAFHHSSRERPSSRRGHHSLHD